MTLFDSTRYFLCRGGVSVLVVWLLGLAVIAEDVAPDLTQLKNIEHRLLACVPNVRKSTLTIYPNDSDVSAGGCLISADGLILTAAHVVMLRKNREAPFRVVFYDGHEGRAEPLGMNLSSDLALLKLSVKASSNAVVAEVAERAPKPGAFAFLLGHPDRKLEGRPAQLRFGMVTYVRVDENGSPVMLICDANIQPGDSGFPLFDLNGNVIGVASSAGTPLGYNRFVPIDCYHRDLSRLKAGQTWGARSEGPTQSPVSYRTDDVGIQRLREEFNRRLTLKFPAAIALGRAHDTPSSQALVNFIGPDIEPVTLGQPFVVGKDSPQWMPALARAVPESRPTIVKLKRGNARLGIGVAVSKTQILVKSSLLTEGVEVVYNGTVVAKSVLAREPAWDLALLELKTDQPLAPVSWGDVSGLQPGSILITLGTAVQPLGWGVVSGPIGTASGDGRLGPLPGKHVVSVHRGPYPQVIPHDTPVGANDMVSLVLDLKGRVVGVNVARKNRTQTLMIPAGNMVKVVKSLLDRTEPTQ